MPVIQADDILDLVKATLPDLGELKWTDIMSSLQRHVMLSEILKKNKVGFKAGRDLQWNVGVAQNNSARMVGLYSVDSVHVVDGLQQAIIPWRHTEASYAIDRHEIAMNREPRKIVDLLRFNRSQCMVSIAEIMETQGWSAPTGSSDALNVMGVPFWIVPNTAQGFNGLNPFGYPAGAGGLSSITYPNWANYTDSYVYVSKTDLIRRMRRAYVFTDFQSPVNADVPSYNQGDRYGIYVTYFVLGLLEESLEQQNDNLGPDVAKMDGVCTFRRTPVMRVPKLEQLSGSGMGSTFSNSTYASTGGYPVNPVYGINWGVFRPVFLEGFYAQETGPMMAPNQHNVMQVFIDYTWNLECRDRRRQWVLTQ